MIYSQDDNKLQIDSSQKQDLSILNNLKQELENQKNNNKQILKDQNFLKEKIELLTKNQLEKDHEIVSLKKINEELNLNIQKISNENEILKNKLNDSNLLIKKVKIKSIQNETEFNDLKNKNINLSNISNNLNKKNNKLFSELEIKNKEIEQLIQEKNEILNKLQIRQLLISSTVNDYEELLKENNYYDIKLKIQEEKF